MKLPSKIPTPIALILLIVVVGGAAFLFESTVKLPSFASGAVKPERVQITNITDTKFTVTWTTASPTTGAITVEGASLVPQTIPDERDTTGTLGKYLTHSVTYAAASPDTTYTLSLVSGGKTFTSDEQGPYQVHTAPALTDPPPGLEPAFGQVVTDDNTPAEGSLVYLRVEGGQTLSSLVTSSGSWVIPLNLSRTETLDAYMPQAERHTAYITVRQDGLETTAITDTLNDSPVPTMVLGKTYDFRKQQADEQHVKEDLAKALPSQQPSSSFGDVAQQVPDVLGTGEYSVRLLTPLDGAALSSQRPLVSGTGIPEKIVTITLGITHPTTVTTRVGQDGAWRYTPEKPLPPGKQSVTVTTQNSADKPVAITHSFRVFESGTQVLGDATPSATFTPTPTTTASATPTFTPTPTATQSVQEIPTSGSMIPTLLLLIGGIAFILSGVFVLL